MIMCYNLDVSTAYWRLFAVLNIHSKMRENMNKNEISEIKKQFTPDRCTIEHICTCYVGSEKEKKFVSKDSFLSLPEEEMHKYLAFFKKVLTGTIGKNVINLEFPTEEEMPGGKQEFLLKLRDSELSDEDMLDKFYDKIIDYYENSEKYCILLIYASYDVPGKASDELDMDDASDFVYNYLLCCICPVELSKGALGYDTDKNRIGELAREWVVQDPDKGFLFPGFSDRQSDIHEMLYYTKKAEELQPEFIDGVFGSEPPLSAGGQKDSFQAIIADTMGETGDLEMMKNIQENIAEIVSENKENPEPLAVGAQEVRTILQRSGVPEENFEDFDVKFEENAGDDASFMMTNIQEKKFTVKTPEIEIHVKPDYLDRIEARVVDGRDCIVISVDDHVQVNGVDVRTIARKKEI